MAIVFTCRQSYREAGLLWYAEPEFILDCCPVMLQEWIEAIGKRNTCTIRRARVGTTSVSSGLTRVMKQFEGLRHVDFET